MAANAQRGAQGNDKRQEHARSRLSIRRSDQDEDAAAQRATDAERNGLCQAEISLEGYTACSLRRGAIATWGAAPLLCDGFSLARAVGIVLEAWPRMVFLHWVIQWSSQPARQCAPQLGDSRGWARRQGFSPLSAMRLVQELALMQQRGIQVDQHDHATSVAVRITLGQARCERTRLCTRAVSALCMAEGRVQSHIRQR